MKISENWLREWVNPDIDTDTLVAKLTQAGLEVDAVEPVAGDFSGVVVGQITAIEPHPDADKLRLCQVDVGGSEALSIVCGATNARQDLKIPVAVVGAVLPGDFKIKEAKLRGVASFGMLCSAKEIGLAESAEGLMELASDAPIGTDIRDYLSLNDVSIDIDLTPNRSDCLGVAGIAREVGVLTGQDITSPPHIQNEVSSERDFPIKVTAGAACPRYVARVIEGINMQAETPLWMQEKLRRSGIRSLSPVVDVTNYVMLEFGQPMHAFDLATLDTAITVRMAAQGETLTLLDSQELSLNDDSVVIADKSDAIALAGIMGGVATSVTDKTQDLLLEAAFFAPTAIAGRARAYGLHTDSSHRFERGVDPELPKIAIERATSLLLEIVGGKAGSIQAVETAESMPVAPIIQLREARIKRVLGITIERPQVVEHLTRLGLGVTEAEAGWDVSIPSFRFDLAIEADLIEELGRLYDYDKLPETRPQGTVLSTDISEATVSVQRLQNLLVDRDYQEAITYSFVAPEFQQYLSLEGQTEIALANPISADLSVMRTSLWPGLVQVAAYNLNRQHTRVRLFEVGRIFTGTVEDVSQQRQIGGIICGSRSPEQWDIAQQAVDFFDIKADVEALLAVGNTNDFSFIAETHPALHPGQSARIYYQEQAIGWLGAIHPKLEKVLGLSQQVYVFELDLAPVLAAKLPIFETLSRFPALRRDLAILVDEDIAATRITNCLNTLESDILKEIQLFDVYSGDGVTEGKKSMAVSFIMQNSERTLTDEEVDALMQQIINCLEAQLSATIRD